MSVTVTYIQSPFRPKESVTEVKKFNHGIISDYFTGSEKYDWVYAKNGTICGNDATVQDGDILSATPKISGGDFGKVVDVVATIFPPVYAAQYFLAKFVSSLVVDPNVDTDVRVADQADQTYGWGTLAQTEKEGTNIPYIFGTNRVSGQVINKFKTVNNNKETLNILLGLCDHEIDSITDIRLNNKSVSSFRDVQTFARLGTNSDAVISGFNEIVTQTSVGVKLYKDMPSIQTTSGDQVEKIIVTITAPGGLYYSNTSGGYDNRSAIYTVEYKKTTDVSWTLAATETKTYNTPTAQIFTTTIDSLDPAKYSIRITRTNDEETSVRGKNTIYWTSYKEIIKQQLIYPGLAKLGIQALATDQLSGSEPSITCLASRNTVQVFNEATGFWESKRATNPAWICYSLLTEYAEVSETRLIYNEFSEWASYCDDLVDGDYRFIVNLVINSGDFWSQIQSIAKLGRASVIRRGTRYGIFLDNPQTQVTAMFNQGNMLDGSFKVSFLTELNRANGAEVEYTDVDRDYERQVITIYSEDYLETGTTPEKERISIDAAISQKQAIREGVYRINSNELINRIFEFQAFIDSFTCTVGDLIYIQNNVSKYGNGISGRITGAGNDNGSGIPYVDIDKSFTVEVDQIYTILVRLRDDTIVEKLISNTPGMYTRLTITVPWSTVPLVTSNEKPIYMVGISTTHKKVARITEITRGDEFTRNITALEYIPEIYTNNDGFIIEEIEETEQSQQASNVLTIENIIYEESGTNYSTLAVSWEVLYEGPKQWIVWLEDITAGTDPIQITKTLSNVATVSRDLIARGNTYNVYINAEEEGAVSFFSNIAQITIQGLDILPDSITEFFVQDNQLIWSYPGNINEIAGFRIKSSIGSNVSWEEAAFVNASEFVTSPYPIFPEGKIITYLVKAYDFIGRESLTAAKVIVNLGDILAQNLTGERILAPAFGGTIINGTAIGNTLFSNNTGSFWTGLDSNTHRTGIDGNLYFATKYLEMTYTFDFLPDFPLVSTIFTVDAYAENGFQIYYRRKQAAEYWTGNDSAPFSIAWSATAGTYRLLTPGILLQNQTYEIKIVVNASSMQAYIDEIKVIYDFPDIVETLNDVLISALGTRLELTKTYQAISNVGLTLQTTGSSTATSLLIADKDVLQGPLIYAYDKDQTQVSATIDARIQGY